MIGRFLGMAVLLAMVPPLRADDAPPDLATQAQGLLKKYCHRCHGGEARKAGLDVLDRAALLAPREEGKDPFVVPRKPEESALWDRVVIERAMPPAKAPQPTAADRQLLGRWIEEGAAFPTPTAQAPARPIRTEHEVLALIRDRLRRAREADRPNLRFFTLHTLSNNTRQTADDLRTARAAVSKLANSLSWKPEIVAPEPIDPEGTVLAIDVRDLGWDDRDLWRVLLGRYPYGLSFAREAPEAVRAVADEVTRLAEVSLPYIRADWFVASASRPPLYHTLLDLPATAQALEDRLQVDPRADFRRDKLARAAFASSGVSAQNRVVDRHVSVFGAYWKSFDFKRNDGRSDVVRFPLGPAAADHPFPRHAFDHAGGEIIFALPNDLHGYLLVDAQGKRIDAGPVEIVSDSQQTAGTAAIVAGLSCMGCHRQGVIRFGDKLLSDLAVTGAARDKAERLYRPKSALDKLLAKDEARYLLALEEAIGPYYPPDPGPAARMRTGPEPVGAVARLYLRDLDAADVAAEFGLSDPDKLGAIGTARLRELGLLPLVTGGTIKRTEWDSLHERLLSTFQQTAGALDIGSPLRITD